MAAPASVLPLVLADVCYEASGQRLIDSISVEFAAGTRTVIMGANGAGKSLLLRLAHGLLSPTSGVVGAATGEAVRLRRAQAMVFQRPVLLRRSTLANVEYVLAARGVGRAERRRRALLALERTGLAALASRSARVLSAGEQQRLALARAWSLEPEILFLDEPTASLDPAATRGVERLVQSIHDAGTKIVMTTHDLGQAKRLADEVLFLHRGRLVEACPAAEFFGGPQSELAGAFLRGELLA
jgi:tungstate transport system ATP-binding protein